MFVSTDTGRNTTEVVGNRSLAWESIWFGLHNHGKPHNRGITVGVRFNRAQTSFANIKC
jgi:hypothetical protein